MISITMNCTHVTLTPYPTLRSSDLNGTLVMPSQTGDLSDPVNWGNPPVPEDWWEEIRQTMPPYHPEITPTRGMGQIADQKSTRLNSSHVATSYEVLLIRYKYHRQYC